MTVMNSNLLDELRPVEFQFDALASLFDLFADAVYVTDTESKLVYVNDAFVELFGYTQSELLGENAYSFLTDGSARRAREKLRELKEPGGKNRIKVKFEVPRPDGDLRMYENHLTCLFDGNGEFRGTVGTIRDVTEVRREQLRRQRYELLFNGVREGLLLVAEDSDGKLRYVEANPAAGDIYGLSPGEMIGERPGDIFPGETAERLLESYRRILEGEEQSLEVEHTDRSPRGEITTRSRLQELELIGGGRGVLIIIEDFTELARTRQKMAEDREAIRRLYNVAGDSDMELEDKVRRLLEVGTERLGLRYGFWAEVEGSLQQITATVGDHPQLEPGEVVPFPREPIEGPVGIDLRTSEEGGWICERIGFETYIGGILSTGSGYEGMLCFGDTHCRSRSFDRGEETFVRLVLQWVRRELELDGLLESLAYRARTDDLTGLLNHGALVTRLEEEIDRVEQSDQALSLLLLDLDKFKEINDCCGHQTGNTVLRKVAKRLDENLRPSDVAARYGGDEFAVILPEASPEEARDIGDRILEHLRERPFETEDGEIEVGCSIGVMTYSGDETAESILREADAALYRGKERGGNTVVSSEARSR